MIRKPKADYNIELIAKLEMGGYSLAWIAKNIYSRDKRALCVYLRRHYKRHENKVVKYEKKGCVI